MSEEQEKTNEDIEEPQEVSEEEALENAKNPERTGEYIEKLKKENKELRKNVLDSLKPESTEPLPPQQVQQPQQQAPKAEDFSHLNQDDIQATLKDMVDDKGYLDGNKLIKTLNDLNLRAAKAEEAAKASAQVATQTAQQAKDQSEKQLMDMVHAKYPQIDPNSEEFDEDFYEAVQNDLIGQMMRGEQDPMKAAEKWHAKMYKDVATKKEKEEAKEKENKKKQINATQTKSSVIKGYYEDYEEQALRQGARTGKKGSVAELLRRRGQ